MSRHNRPTTDPDKSQADSFDFAGVAALTVTIQGAMSVLYTLFEGTISTVPARLFVWIYIYPEIC